MKDYAANRFAVKVISSTDGPTLQSFVRVHAGEDAVICTDEHGAYAGLAADHVHETVTMATFVAGTVGKRLHYRAPSADNGLANGVRS